MTDTGAYILIIYFITSPAPVVVDKYTDLDECISVGEQWRKQGGGTVPNPNKYNCIRAPGTKAAATKQQDPPKWAPGMP